MTRAEHLRRLCLFFISYGPLWLMLAFRTLPSPGHWRWGSTSTWATAVLALAAVWAFVDGRRLVAGAQRKGAIRLRFSEVRDEGSAAAGYLATYLVPLLASGPTRAAEWVAYGLYAAMAVLVFVRTDLALINPTLYLFGWRVVSATIGDPSEPAMSVVVICRDIRSLREEVDVVRLAGCYVTKNEPRYHPGATLV